MENERMLGSRRRVEKSSGALRDRSRSCSNGGQTVSKMNKQVASSRCRCNPKKRGPFRIAGLGDLFSSPKSANFALLAYPLRLPRLLFSSPKLTPKRSPANPSSGCCRPFASIVPASPLSSLVQLSYCSLYCRATPFSFSSDER
jgi:hypothetical protein